MRTSTFVLLIATQLVACNQGVRKYDPLHRSPVAPEVKTTKTPVSPTAEAPAQPAADVPREVALATIADRPWCTLRKAGFTFIVERYTFAGGETPATTNEILAFTPNREPVARPPKTLDRWVEIKGDKINTEAGVIGVEALTADVAQATPAFADQGRLLNEMVGQIELEVSPDSIGDDGAVRLSRPGQPEQILFDCQNFSATFVGAHAPSAAAAPSAPAPVDPAARGTAAALRGPLVGLPVVADQLPATRWCSYKKIEDDVVVGLLQFGLKKSVTLSHLRASVLKTKAAGKREFKKAAIHAPIETAITGVRDNVIVTALGKSFRLIGDANQTRALVLDTAAGPAAPSSTAEIFFECRDENDPIRDENVAKNLAAYLNLRAGR